MILYPRVRTFSPTSTCRSEVLSAHSTALGVAAVASPAVLRCLLMARATCEVRRRVIAQEFHGIFIGYLWDIHGISRGISRVFMGHLDDSETLDVNVVILWFNRDTEILDDILIGSEGDKIMETEV